MVDFPPRPTAEEAAAMAKRLRGRNLAMGLALGALAVLFFAITMVKLSSKAMGG